MLDVPYRQQEKDWWCGPASLQMVAAYYGKTISQQQVAPIDDDVPTMNADLARKGEEIGLEVEAKKNATLEDIAAFISQNIPVIVNFIEATEDEGHFAVVVDIDENTITFHDPWHGEAQTMSRADFASRWRSGFESDISCLLAVKKGST